MCSGGHPVTRRSDAACGRRRLARQTHRLQQAAQLRSAVEYARAVPHKRVTLDHVHPRSRGGENLTSNLVPACARCNSQKGSTNVWEWYRAQPFYSELRELEIRAWLEQGNLTGEENWETLIPLFQDREAA